MPLPKPNEGETNQQFVDRCMDELNEEFPDREQRFAVCGQQLDKKSEKGLEDAVDNLIKKIK